MKINSGRKRGNLLFVRVCVILSYIIYFAAGLTCSMLSRLAASSPSDDSALLASTRTAGRERAELLRRSDDPSNLMSTGGLGRKRSPSYSSTAALRRGRRTDPPSPPSPPPRAVLRRLEKGERGRGPWE